MFYGLVESNVVIPSGKLDYIAFGNGKKNLIMIQGLNVRDIKGAGASLAIMYKMFVKEYRVYVFDRRTKVEEDLTHGDLAEDIYDAMNVLNIDSADVIGISQGGMIAIALTLEHPECVNKLVLGVTASRVNDNLKRVVGKWVDCAHKGDFISINKDTFSLMYSDAYLKKYKLLMPLAVRVVKPKDFNRFAILASAILNFDYYDRLSEIKCPVLVLGADRDQITTGSASREIADKLKCEIYMYGEYGHAVYEEAKDYNKRIFEFLMR